MTALNDHAVTEGTAVQIRPVHTATGQRGRRMATSTRSGELFASSPPAERATHRETATTAAPKLSDREVQVLRAWLLSDSKREAAARLFITEATVSTHLTRIKAKYAALGRPARTKVALFVRAVQDGHTTFDEH